MSEKLITVVVPVYKVEPYIDKCLSSLIVPEEQLPLLEVIVVNDGTPDRSAEMAREYEKRYPDVFRVIDKENGGHGSAWNRGVKEATGKYLRFLDSDDWFTTSEFSRLIERLKTLDVDVVISNYNRYYTETGETIKHPMYLEDGVDQTFTSEVFDWDKLSWEQMHFWGCTYRSEWLKKEYPLFRERVVYDDYVLFIAPLLICKTIHVFDAIIYNYLLGRVGQSVTLKTKRNNIAQDVACHFQLLDFASNHYGGVGQNLSKHLQKYLKEQLHETLVIISKAEYRHCKKWMKEWEQRYRTISALFPNTCLSSNSIRSYFNCPFPLFFIFRRALSLIQGYK